MRRIVLPVFTLLATLVAAAPAHAAESTARCDAMLEDADLARTSLEQMELTLADLQSEKATLEQRILELQVDIRFAKVGGNDKVAKKLAAELKATEKQLGFVEELRPSIEAQVIALRDSVSSTEREYIACIESTIAH